MLFLVVWCGIGIDLESESRKFGNRNRHRNRDFENLGIGIGIEKISWNRNRNRGFRNRLESHSSSNCQVYIRGGVQEGCSKWNTLIPLEQCLEEAPWG